MSEDLTKKLPESDNTEIVLILQSIDSRLHSLEHKVEERLSDTRPIWEKVVADVTQLQTGVTQLKTDVTQLKTDVTQLQVGQRRLEETMSSEFREVKNSIREVFYQIGAIGETMVGFQGNMRYIDSRVRELEQRSHNQSKPQT